MPTSPRPTDRRPLCGVAGQGASALKLFPLVFALSIPFWLIGSLTRLQLMEGLPVSSLAGFCPLAAALILSHRAKGAIGARGLLRRTFDYGRIGAKIWYAPILLLMPAIVTATYGLMRWRRLPVPPLEIRFITALVMFLVFFIEAAGEELGWMGYAVDPIQARQGALRASLLLGGVGAAWHLVLFAQAGRSLGWIGWQSLFIVVSRVVIVSLYNSTGGSVFGAILFHTMINLSSFLFPSYGSHYDPRLTALVTCVVAAIVTLLWGPRRLAGDRGAALRSSPMA